MKNKSLFIFTFVLPLLIFTVIFTHVINEKKYNKKNKKDYNSSINYDLVESRIYPVGSIYISVTDDTVSKVQARFGGTWEKYGTGKTIISVDSDNTNYNTSEKTGGNATVTLSTGNLPAHTHTATPAGTVSSTFSGSSVTLVSNGAHTHTVNYTLGSTGAHTHTVNYSLASAGAHTHSLSARTSSSAGAHTHTLQIKKNSSVYTAVHWGGYVKNTSKYHGSFNYNEAVANTSGITSAGAHTHSASYTLASAGDHKHTVPASTAQSAGGHTHSVPASTAQSAGGHTHTVTATGTVKDSSGNANAATFTGTATNTSSVGSGNSFSIVQPYITVYMYKRTA